MNEMAQRGKKATDAAVRAAQQTSTAMQYLQMQQQQLAVSARTIMIEVAAETSGLSVASRGAFQINIWRAIVVELLISTGHSPV